MPPQPPRSATALFKRLQPVYDDSFKAKVIDPVAMKSWPRGARPKDAAPDDGDPDFGGWMEDVRALVPHTTSGWPSRHKAQGFVDRYIKPGTSDRGIGPHFYLANDGTVFELIDAGRVAWHARPINGVSIGVETGNLASTATPPGNGWKGLDDKSKEDIPGAKFYAVINEGEYLICAWTTSKSWQPPDGAMEKPVMMLLSEQQYRSWALLARWICEVYEIPRTFPLRPHIKRDGMLSAGSKTSPTARWRRFRTLVDAEPTKAALLRALVAGSVKPASIAHLGTAPLKSAAEYADDKVFPDRFKAAIGSNAHATVNDIWTQMIQLYRGIHGHAFSGDAKGGDHNCPGPLFDWHRFARDVWDYWWFPFDAWLPGVALLGPLVNRARREYGPSSATLQEYYFDSLGSQHYRLTSQGFFPIAGEEPAGAASAGVPSEVNGAYWGHLHGGMHFELLDRVPIYAACAGQIVAARFPKPAPPAPPAAAAPAPAPPAAATPAPAVVESLSDSFVLLRHEVFHVLGTAPRLDYDKEPAVVYSLYMHLSPPDAMTYDAPSPKNPDWLNRVLATKKECDLGIAFHKAHPKPADAWKRRAGAIPATLPEVWERDQKAMNAVLDSLRAGKLAVFPEGEGAVRVSLGDFLGMSGAIAPRDPLGVTVSAVHGLHFEVFSKDLVSPDFKLEDMASSEPFYGAKVAARVTELLARTFGSVKAYRDKTPAQRTKLFERTAVKSKSEWSLKAADFPAGGWAEAAPFSFWADLVAAMQKNKDTPAAALLPADGVVHHYHPFGFMDWINDRTWKSEWPKFRVYEVDAAGKPTTTLAPAPSEPPRRRGL